ncbi:hypothetical protein FGSG_12446 [Fusarium graminearum PH-1]|uniref:Chromosome 2, complete genome n=1 Tax=Gibberella zeae (strain ATCC MYA-4620 / CBS 123657 / FGSC 9075 / NRRL 31084 / PH-1) TaxID=229533 RepID=I1S6H5_GIBZE|nr:hypothetical protein FGSG_12446 [Fusarium graminearum PH-1]ESU09849.1 hypothetical protein FGSG_12446 [Fusarium graminearum PH-1]CEF78172.1 unnamed protein product [Fusarium graminearum]|eukprot:XP_011322348.1 hypothetical protein FGSG_12446 [Fusarium graminearum PH-1]
MMLVQDELGDFCVHMVGHSEFWSLDPEVEVSGRPYLIIFHPTLCLVEPDFADGKGDIDIHLKVAGKQSGEFTGSASGSRYSSSIFPKQNKRRKKCDAPNNAMLQCNFITSNPSSERSCCASLCGYHGNDNAIDRRAL